MQLISERSRVWDGYYMLLVSRSDSSSDIQRALSDAGFKFIAKENTRVPFFDYEGTEYVPLPEIRARFLPFDPRIDDYSKRILSYFTTASGDDQRDILYIESNAPPLIFALKMGAILSAYGKDGLIADFNWTGTIINVYIFLTLAAFFVFASRLPKILPILVALPWIEFFIMGAECRGTGPLLLYAAILTALEYLRPLYEEDFRGIPHAKAQAVWIGVMVVSAIIVSLSAMVRISGWDYSLAFTGWGIASALLIAGAYGAFLRIASERMEHPRFDPLPLFEGTPYADRTVDRRKISVVSVLLLVSLFLPWVSRSGSGFPVPVPVHCKDVEDFSWQSITVLAQHDEPDSLPDLSDYLTHMAYQEGFLYNREYNFPNRNEAIEITRFSQQSGTIFSRTDCVRQFTDNWYTDIMANASDNGITALLLAQEYPAGVVTREIKKQVLISGETRERFLAGLIALSPFSLQATLNRGMLQRSSKD